MRSMIIAYGLIVGALVLVYLLVIFLLMRLARRKEERRMGEAQEALADGRLHGSTRRAGDAPRGARTLPMNEDPSATE